MTPERRTHIVVESIHLEEPIEKIPGSQITKIVVSEERFSLIKSKLTLVTMTTNPMTSSDYLDFAEVGANLANALIPRRTDKLLSEILTPKQYQKALAANQSGRILKFVRHKR